MKRILWLCVCLLSVVATEAQVQQGYVRTLGRPDKKGEALSGVAVRVNIGYIFNNKGDYHQALNYLEKAYNIYKELFGEENSTTRSMKDNVEFLKQQVK